MFTLVIVAFFTIVTLILSLVRTVALSLACMVFELKSVAFNVTSLVPSSVIAIVVKLTSIAMEVVVWFNSGKVQSIFPVVLLEKSGVTFATSKTSPQTSPAIRQGG